MENITFDEFQQAIHDLTPFVQNTPMDYFQENIYLKRESQQTTNSFKWRGVLYCVMNAFKELENENIDISFNEIFEVFNFVKKDLMKKNLENGFYFIKDFIRNNMNKNIYDNNINENEEFDITKRSNRFVIQTILKAYEYLTFNLFRNERFK